MRVLLGVIDSTAESATAAEMASIDAFNEKLRANGQLIFACGIAAPESSIVVDNRNNAGHITEGPLSSAAEFLSGFWILEVDGREQAVSLALAASLACNRRLEMRVLLG
ncbi:MAG: YciI family protein [Agromyces sp.]